MKILFDPADDAQSVLNSILTYLDVDIDFESLQPDIELVTPYLIDFVGQAMYDKAYAHFENPPGQTDEELDDVLKLFRTYVLCEAYLNYSPNNDLTHSTSGRAFRADENERIAWEWQVNADDAATMKRGYKALDLAIRKLDDNEYSEWVNSDEYKRSKRTLIHNTKQFDEIYPIGRSGQLYYRMVPFMENFELQKILPILGQSKYDQLKTAALATDQTDEQKRLLTIARSALAYLTLGKAYKVFPIEMFPDKVSYSENTTQKSKARAEVMMFINSEAEKYLKQLEDQNALDEATFEAKETMPGLNDDQKFVSL